MLVNGRMALAAVQLMTQLTTVLPLVLREKMLTINNYFDKNFGRIFPRQGKRRVTLLLIHQLLLNRMLILIRPKSYLHHQVLYDPPDKCSPDGVILNKYSSFMPPGVSTNITSTTNLLQYIYLDGIPNPLQKSTPSDNIVGKDRFFKKSVSRELSFVHIDPPQSNIQQLAFHPGMLPFLAHVFYHILPSLAIYQPTY